MCLVFLKFAFFNVSSVGSFKRFGLEQDGAAPCVRGCTVWGRDGEQVVSAYQGSPGHVVPDGPLSARLCLLVCEMGLLKESDEVRCARKGWESSWSGNLLLLNACV